MKRNLVIPLVVGSLALTGLVFTFVNGASPYVDIAQAKTSSRDDLHLKGKIVAGSIHPEPRNRVINFEIQDESGSVMPVVYHGSPPANMGEATQVVAIGECKNGTFHSEQLLLKCPSKYESQKGGPASQ